MSMVANEVFECRFADGAARRPTRTIWCAGLIIAALVVALGACKPPCLTVVERLGPKLKTGDEEAFLEVGRLSNEDQILLIPALTEAYDSNVRTSEVVGLLLDIGHPDGLPVFLSALENEDYRLAGLAARGIGTVGSASEVSAVANRLRRIQDPNEFGPFLEALGNLPGDPSASPAIVDIITRPAGTVGGPTTIKLGCAILGKSGATDEATIEAMIFGLVNSAPPFLDNPTEACIRGLAQVGDAAVPGLMRVLRNENAQVLAVVQQLGKTGTVAGLWATRALADLRSTSATQPMLAWFGSPHTVSAGELTQMPIEMATEWFSHFGQLLTGAIEYLEVTAVANNDQDPARAALLGLIQRGEGQLIENFVDYMGTSDDAEWGLRRLALQALANLGNRNDREIFFTMAQTGVLSRNADRLIKFDAAHVFALMSQPGDMARFETLVQATENTTLLEQLNFLRPMVQLAEDCQNDIACLTAALANENDLVQKKAAYDLVHHGENRVAGAAAVLAALESADYADRFTFLAQLRRATLPANAGEVVQALLDGLEGQRGSEVVTFRHQLRLMQLVRLGE